jgi:hypothetical protein
MTLSRRIHSLEQAQMMAHDHGFFEDAQRIGKELAELYREQEQAIMDRCERVRETMAARRIYVSEMN